MRGQNNEHCVVHVSGLCIVKGRVRDREERVDRKFISGPFSPAFTNCMTTLAHRAQVAHWLLKLSVPNSLRTQTYFRLRSQATCRTQCYSVKV